jgi:alanine dehydrogenase
MNFSDELFPELEPQEEFIKLDSPKRNFSVGFLKDKNPIKGVVLLSPYSVSKLVEANVQVWIQRGISTHTSWSDLDYADIGAVILDDASSVITQSNILIKLEPFTTEEIALLKPNQIIISHLRLLDLTPELFTVFRQKNISAIALDFIKGKKDKYTFEEIFLDTLGENSISLALGEFVLPILFSLVYSVSLKDSIQTCAALIQGVYCYNGILCNGIIAEKLNLPWKDILLLCWNQN